MHFISTNKSKRRPSNGGGFHTKYRFKKTASMSAVVSFKRWRKYASC